MWPFSRKPLLDEDAPSWHLDGFEWLVGSFADRRSFAATRLILPGPGFFVHDGEVGHALAERLFRQVEDYCDLPGEPLDLVAEDFVPDDADARYSAAYNTVATLWRPIPQVAEVCWSAISPHLCASRPS